MFKNYIFIILVILNLLVACGDQNHIEKYNVKSEILQELPDSFYGYRNGSIYIVDGNEKYMIWFDLTTFGNVKNIFEIKDLETRNVDKSFVINKYKLDTLKLKLVAQKFIDFSSEYKFGHVNIDRKNKIAFSYKDGLPEQYVMTFNDSISAEYQKNKSFTRLKNGWFENKEK